MRSFNGDWPYIHVLSYSSLQSAYSVILQCKPPCVQTYHAKKKEQKTKLKLVRWNETAHENGFLCMSRKPIAHAAHTRANISKGGYSVGDTGGAVWRMFSEMRRLSISKWAKVYFGQESNSSHRRCRRAFYHLTTDAFFFFIVSSQKPGSQWYTWIVNANVRCVTYDCSSHYGKCLPMSS